MKTNLSFGFIAVLLFSTAIIISCQKTDLSSPESKKSEDQVVYVTGTRQPSGLVEASGVTLSAPEIVNVNQSFNITATINCGRVALERGYILGAGGVKIYKNLTCSSANLNWEEFVTFQCYTTDASWNGSLSEVGTYVFRTKHNAADGNCDGLGGSDQSGNCSFSGNQVCCFSIEVIDPCVNSFTGEAVSCGNQRQAIYHFTAAEAGYIKIQGGLTNFTGSNAIVTIAGASLTETQSTPGGSSNRIIKLEGTVEACADITITINWNSTNSGGIITGDWSVKDINGLELAPSVPGLQCAAGRSK